MPSREMIVVKIVEKVGIKRKKESRFLEAGESLK
jgi:hypothetical protein